MVKVGIVSLGCPRNLVDSEVMLGSLKKEGYIISDEVGDGVDLFIVNTCSFVESAREESIDTILEAAALKKEGKIKYLIVAGCLSQSFGAKLLKSLPEVDLIIGTSDFPKISGMVKALLNNNFPAPARKHRSAVSKKLDYLYDENSPRFSLTPPHFAYVKISEGCDNLCSYCIISSLRGKFRSRSIESVIKEAGNLSSSGALREINLIGQDTTMFGADAYGESKLPELLKSIASLKNSVKWIRLLYTHPAHYNDEIIRVLRDEKKMCRYLDLPVQHISNTILKKMNRHTTKDEIIKLIDNIRKNIPAVALRTSIIVGFPGETDREFEELLSFLRDTRFEKLGAFVYSAESGSAAAKFGKQVPERIKNQRFDELMKSQQKISNDINKSLMGKTLEVLIDEKIDSRSGGFPAFETPHKRGPAPRENLHYGRKSPDLGTFMGRTESDAPEVDGCIYVSGKNIRVGEFCKVKITDTLEYDLVGDVIL